MRGGWAQQARGRGELPEAEQEELARVQEDMPGPAQEGAGSNQASSLCCALASPSVREAQQNLHALQSTVVAPWGRAVTLGTESKVSTAGRAPDTAQQRRQPFSGCQGWRVHRPLPEHRLWSECRCGSAGSGAEEESKCQRGDGSPGAAASPP